MPNAFFYIAGIRLEVHSRDAGFAQDFALDFQNLKTNAAKPDIKLTVKLAAPPNALQKLRKRLFPFTSGIRFRDFGHKRLVSYPEGAMLLHDYSRETACLWTERYHLARELAYLCALSRIGFLLDLKGLHRVHASAIRLDGKTIMMSGASGSGKSTLALLLALDGKAELCSDDFPLMDSTGTVFPFPVRPAIGSDNALAGKNLPHRVLQRRKHGQKLLLDPRAFRWTGTPSKIGYFVSIAGRSEKAAMKKLPKTAAFLHLLGSLVLGLGLPQVAELLAPLSVSSAARLGMIALSRLRTALALCLRAECRLLHPGGSAEGTAKTLSEHIHRQAGQKNPAA